MENTANFLTPFSSYEAEICDFCGRIEVREVWGGGEVKKMTK
jgi:hypothetical protein